MTTLESRERAFEGKHGHGWEFRFPAAARHGKPPAGRAADRLALAGRDRTVPPLTVPALLGGPRHDAPLIPRLAGASLDRGGIVRDAEAAGLLGGLRRPGEAASSGRRRRAR